MLERSRRHWIRAGGLGDSGIVRPRLQDQCCKPDADGSGKRPYAVRRTPYAYACAAARRRHRRYPYAGTLASATAATQHTAAAAATGSRGNNTAASSA